jgi:hypothetical protein
MSAMFDRLDRFVRWFFNSSPTTMLIEPSPKFRPSANSPASGDRSDLASDLPRSQGQGAKPGRSAIERGGAMGGGIAALALLSAFYGVVSDGTDRAATRKASLAQASSSAMAPPAETMRSLPHPAFARQRLALGRLAD